MSLQAFDHAHAWLRFVLRPGVPPRAQRRLLTHFGSPHAANAARYDEVAALAGVEVAGAFMRGPSTELLDATLRWLRAPQHHVVALGDAAYPPLLLQIPDPPTLIYACGRVELLSQPSLAIVGSRNATPRGLADAEDLAYHVSEHGLCVVSGMARGVDASAHRGALRARGSSIAVLGTGIDVVYPRTHQDLARDLEAHGCLVSELPLGTPPLGGNFPRRNRLISGLTRGIVVVEAASQSGSLITARCALDQNRDVFAMPGSIHSALAKGCHALIKEGAILVENAADVLREYGIEMAAPCDAAPDAREDPLLDAMGFAPMCVDAIAGLTGLAAAEVSAQLVTLQIEGRVKATGGGLFQRVRGRSGSAL